MCLLVDTYIFLNDKHFNSAYNRIHAEKKSHARKKDIYSCAIPLRLGCETFTDVYAVKLSRLGCETSTVIVKKSAFKFGW